MSRSLLHDIPGDLRVALRQLRRAPGYTLVAVLVLALGIGASTAIFGIVDGVLLRPLPYPEADRLHLLYESNGSGGQRLPSYPTFEDWRREGRGWAGLAYARGEDFTVEGERGPERLIAAYVSEGFFETIGTAPALGRTFAGGARQADRVVVITHALWQRRFGGDPAAIGQSIVTPDGAFTVVGVMPRGYREPEWADAWVPLGTLPPAARYALERRDLHVDSRIYGRLAPGTGREQGIAELTRVARRLAEAYPTEQGTWRAADATPLADTILAGVRTQLLVLAGAVGLVLLVACVNVASLQLARATARTRELAVRSALGASRGRLVRQLLAESVVLAAASGALGVLLAWLGVRWLTVSLPTVLPRLDEVRMDGRVLLAAVALSALTVLLFGLLPAWRAASPSLVASLKAGTGGSGEARGTVRLRSALVVAELALAVVLVVGAALLLDTLRRIGRVPLGFETEHVAAVRIFPPADRYAEPAAALALFERLRAAAAAVPGVESAALANHLPLMGGWMVTKVETGAAPGPDGPPNALHRVVSPEYFETLDVAVRQGRALRAEDVAAPGAGVVINEALARRLWGDEPAVGRGITIYHSAQGRDDFGQPIRASVVGVVENERFFGADRDPSEAVYLPHTWDVWQHITLAVRTRGEPALVIPALRRALLAVDPALPIAGPALHTDLQPLEAHLGAQLQGRRLNGSLLGGFALATLLLSAIGVAGVVAYVIGQRRREFGVRMALGAQAGDVLALVARQAAGLTLAGVLAGVVGALAATRVLASQLYGVSATEPAIFVAVPLVTAVAVLAAALVPARRVTRVSPTEALRAD